MFAKIICIDKDYFDSQGYCLVVADNFEDSVPDSNCCFDYMDYRAAALDCMGYFDYMAVVLDQDYIDLAHTDFGCSYLVDIEVD